MKSFYLIALFCGLFLLTPTHSHAQSWQWGRSTKNLPSSNSSFENNRIATDPNGNLYTVSVAANIDIPWHFRAGYGTSNLCIISYDCAGNFRWGKMIENASATEIKTDEIGGVYINGLIGASTKSLKLDEDTIIPQTEKTVIFVKFDTAGNFKWYRMPESDTIHPKGYDFTSLTMDVAPNGHSRIFTITRAGSFCDNNYTVTDTPFSAHIVGYDANGNFNFGVPLDMKTNIYISDLFYHKMVWDKANDKFYIYPTGNFNSISYGSTVLTKAILVLAKFNNTGRNEWVKKGTDISGGYNLFPNVISDKDGSIYLNCRAGVGDSFDGYTFSNEEGKGTTTAILKYDKNGNRVWVANTKVERGFLGAFRFALSNNILAAFAPLGGDTFVRWESGYEVGKSFKTTIGGDFTDSFNFGSYFVRFDATTGKVINVDSILGARINPYSMCGNAKGGFYISGMMNGIVQKLLIPGGNTIKGIYPTSPSSPKSPFLLKYGTNDCGITTVPEILINENKLKLYPNPSGDFIFIENAAANSQLNIFNTMGQLLSQRIVSDATTRIDVQHLPTGIYILEMTDKNNQKQRLKLMKQ